jgi:hypothetical protein
MTMKKREARSEKREGRRAIHPVRVSRRQRVAFAFTEVLFAVMVLGIGFIMIAAMFPVTIRQTQSTMQDTHGANTAKGALAYLQSIASNVNFPVTSASGSPVVCSLQTAPGPAAAGTPPGYLEARGNFIDPNNPRIAWVPLYRRGVAVDGTPDPYAQVIIIVIQSRNRPQYTAIPQPAGNNKFWSDLTPLDPSFPGATITPLSVPVKLKYNAVTGNGEMTFTNMVGPPVPASTPLAPGAYVVIAKDSSGKSNGRIYQLGNLLDAATQRWSLAPGGDMIVRTPATTSDDNDLTTATQAFIIGRGYADLSLPFDNTNPAQGFAGPAQEIAVYTGFVQISR